MRRTFIRSVVALLALALTLGPAAASAGETNAPGIDFSWSPTTLTVAGSELPGRVRVSVWSTSGTGDWWNDVLLGQVEVDPSTPAAAVTLSSLRGTHHYLAKAERWLDGLGWAPYATSSATLTFAGRESTLTATLPSGTVRQGASVRITGRLDGNVHRPVQIQHRARNGTWVTLAETRPAADGRFAVAAPTWWVADQTLRAYAPGTPKDQPAASEISSLTVAPRSAPRSGSAYSLISRRNRWDPCSGPLTYRISDRVRTRFPLRPMVREAFSQVSAATGLRFRYLGGSHRVPFAKARGRFPRGTDFLLGWVDPAATHLPAAWWRRSAGRGGSAVGHGEVALNAHGPTRWRQMDRHDWQIVVLHEVGHALGLDHVADRRQLMSEHPYGNAATYGAGDLRGLAAIGADAGCV